MLTLHVKAEQNHMATTFAFTIACAKSESKRAERLLKSCHRLVSDLEASLTEYSARSAVYRLNHSSPAQQWVVLQEHEFRLLRYALKLSEQVGGTFDPTAKSSKAALALTLKSRIEIDVSNQRARRLHAGVHLGFGAIGKGYALDQVRLVLEREGFRDFCLSAGGSSTVLSGESAPSVPWRFGWLWSQKVGAQSQGLVLSHGSQKPISLGVSGTHEKGFHLIDPRAARGDAQSATPPLSALVAHPHATDSDALSTALFVGGFEHALEQLKDSPHEIALAEIDAQGVPRWNGIFQKYWGSLGMLVFWLMPLAHASESVDLASDGALEHFNPYIFDRDPLWLILPAFGIFYVLLHLFQNKKRPKRPSSDTLERNSQT